VIVCLCNRVSDRDIHQAVKVHGVRDFEVLKDRTRAASCCGACHDCAREVFDEACKGLPVGIASKPAPSLSQA
jgi:bacterioferritin-associated ferredoxin